MDSSKCDFLFVTNDFYFDYWAFIKSCLNLKIKNTWKKKLYKKAFSFSSKLLHAIHWTSLIGHRTTLLVKLWIWWIVLNLRIDYIFSTFANGRNWTSRFLQIDEAVGVLSRERCILAWCIVHTVTIQCMQCILCNAYYTWCITPRNYLLNNL